MKPSYPLLFALPLALVLRLWLATSPATGQDRGDYEGRAPLWAKALIEAIRADQATKPRYEYHPRGDTTLVFDTQTGCSYSISSDAKTLRVEDPVQGRVFLKRAETIDHTVGGVIRAR